MTNALVVDDSRVQADALCQILNLLNVDTQVTYGSMSALGFLNQAMPDVIFLDINMPGASGFEVLCYIKREPRIAHIPVIFITADESLDTAARAHKEGAFALLVKPTSIDEIETVLKTAKII